jgi:PqqD family protein of HPr-rel-A system
MREWDDEVVVYHSGSGETHLLNAVAFATLDRFGTGGTDEDTVVEDVSRRFGSENDPAFRESVRALILHLDDIGLIEAAAGP